jgi:hypothetical protein
METSYAVHERETDIESAPFWIAALAYPLSDMLGQYYDRLQLHYNEVAVVAFTCYAPLMTLAVWPNLALLGLSISLGTLFVITAMIVLIAIGLTELYEAIGEENTLHNEARYAIGIVSLVFAGIVFLLLIDPGIIYLF